MSNVIAIPFSYEEGIPQIKDMIEDHAFNFGFPNQMVRELIEDNKPFLREDLYKTVGDASLGCVVILFSRKYDDLHPIGYASLMANPLLHCAGRCFVSMEALYIRPENRGKISTLRTLLSKAEEVALYWDPTHLAFSCAIDSRASGVMRRFGYASEEVVLIKKIIKSPQN